MPCIYNNFYFLNIKYVFAHKFQSKSKTLSVINVETIKMSVVCNYIRYIYTLHF